MITQCKRCGFKNYDPYLRLPSCGHCHQDPYTKAPEVSFVEREGHLDETLRCKARLLMKMAKATGTDPLKMPEVVNLPRTFDELRSQFNGPPPSWLVNGPAKGQRYGRGLTLGEWIDAQEKLLGRKLKFKASGLIPQRVYSDGMHPNYVDGDFRLLVERSVNRHMFEFIVNHGHYSHMEAISADAVFAAREKHHGMEDLCAYVVNKLRTYIEGEKP